MALDAAPVASENDAAKAPARQLVLPVLVFGTVEIHRLLRELEALDTYFESAALRASGSAAVPLPKVSRVLDTVASENGMSLLQAPNRQKLMAFLQAILKRAPSVHISFAADPSAAFTAKIVGWLRSNVHPYALLSLGLQPGIAAGCVVRTPNKLFDFSLRSRFTERRDKLLAALETQHP